MSSNEIDAALSRAHALVEDGKLDEARVILEPIIASDRNNADAWWIYAHAVATPEEGINALRNVLRIAPNYPGAAELMAMAQETAEPSAVPSITPIGAAQPTPSAPSNLPEPDIEDTQTRPAAAPPRRGGLPIAPVLAVIVIIILVVLVIVSQSGNPPPATPTQAVILVSPSQPIVAPSTAEVTEAQPTVTALVVETTPVVAASEQAVPSQAAAVTQSVASTAEATTSSAQATADFSAVRGALAQFSIAQNGIVQSQTSLGNTLLVSVCTTPGRAMRALLPQVMDALAKQSSSLDASIQAIGARMINCDQNTPLLTVAVDMASAKSYAQGKLTDAQFAPMWKPQS